MSGSQTSTSATTARDRWAPALQSAIEEVFELMLASPVTLAAGQPRQQILDITSMVGLAGELNGILTIRCSSASAAQMASRMLGIDPEKAGPAMWDAVGEICNMVAGNFKNKVAGLGDACVLSVPTVIKGSDYMPGTNQNENLEMVFLFAGEPVVLSLEPQQDSRNRF